MVDAPDIDIPVLYNGGSFLVIDKPTRVLTHAHHIDKESPILLDILSKKLGRKPLSVHRLDRMTTGAMLVALDKETASALAGQFAAHDVGKKYLAVTRGHVADDGTFDEPLPHRSKNEVLEAETRFRCLARGRIDEPLGRYDEGWFSLVLVELLTGRTHQARRHLRRANHPILGDKRHGDNDYNRWAQIRFGLYMFLRSWEITFTEPVTDNVIRVRSGLTEPWQTLMQQLFGGVPAELDINPEVTVTRGTRGRQQGSALSTEERPG
jgi:tRNA pseudouridine65 synthase